jgi:hypothetical protein
VHRSVHTRSALTLLPRTPQCGSTVCRCAAAAAARTTPQCTHTHLRSSQLRPGQKNQSMPAAQHSTERTPCGFNGAHDIAPHDTTSTACACHACLHAQAPRHGSAPAHATTLARTGRPAIATQVGGVDELAAHAVDPHQARGRGRLQHVQQLQRHTQACCGHGLCEEEGFGSAL